jgi:hypothetical protein
LTPDVDRPQSSTPPHPVVIIVDGSLQIAALELAAAGAVFAALGLVTGLTVVAALPIVPIIVVASLCTLCAGLWLARRPREILVDSVEAVIKVRGPTRNRDFTFMQIVHIDLRRARSAMVLPSDPFLFAETYEVIFCFLDGSEVATLKGIGLAEARSETKRLADLTGASVFSDPL